MFTQRVHNFFLKIKKNFFNVCLFLRELQSMNLEGAERERERERETENLKQALGSELSAQSLMRGLNPWTARL